MKQETSSLAEKVEEWGWRIGSLKGKRNLEGVGLERGRVN